MVEDLEICDNLLIIKF